MPVEVKELVIRTIVAPEGGQTSASSQPVQQTGAINQQELIQKCVNEVMRILKQKESR